MRDIKQYKRILILGPPGAGKTFFGKELSKILQLPLHHLDDYYWLPNWQRVDAKKWEEILHELCSQTHWIIDGNHFKTLEKRLPYADMVILIDLSVFVCLWRFIIRSIKRYFGNKDTLPINIMSDTNYKPKFSIQWHLVKLIAFFKIYTKPKIMKLIDKYQAKLIIVSSKKSSDALLQYKM